MYSFVYQPEMILSNFSSLWLQGEVRALYITQRYKAHCMIRL